MVPVAATTPTTLLNISDVLVFSQAETTIVLAEGAHSTTHWCLVQSAQVSIHASCSVFVRIGSLTLAQGTNLHFFPSPGVSITLEWYPSEPAFLPATFGSDSVQERRLFQDWTDLQSAKYVLEQVTYRLSRYVRMREPGEPTDLDSAPLLKARLEAQGVVTDLLDRWETKVGPGKRLVTFLSLILL
jgi:hypothetical protein